MRWVLGLIGTGIDGRSLPGWHDPPNLWTVPVGVAGAGTACPQGATFLRSTMPIIKSFDAPPSYKPGSISRRPEPTLTGRGEKRAK
jgi:hypothetical protein